VRVPAASEVRLAARADRTAVVATVVAAFDRDPAFRFFFDDDDFAAQASAFAAALFDRRVARGGVWVVDDGDAVAMWDPPAAADDATPAEGDDVEALPESARARLHVYDTAVHALMPTEPHWYLGILASHPRRTGEGLGRAVVQPGLAAARADGRPAYLETSTAANVAMYTRRGWTVGDVVQVEGMTVTVLRHDGSG
jgi:GNAT superfamily N-acetyltransferase